MEVKITVKNDFDNFFEAFTKDLFHKIENPDITEVIISAEPYKDSDVAFAFNQKTGILKLEYYSAVRVFGWSFNTLELIEEFRKFKII